MEKNFDFKTVGKRMPYVMPEGFLADMGNRVMESLKAKTASRGKCRIYNLFRGMVAAAAVATLFIVCHSALQPRNMYVYSDLDQAFDNLSYDDQQLMIDVYDNDVFMSDTYNSNL